MSYQERYQSRPGTHGRTPGIRRALKALSAAKKRNVARVKAGKKPVIAGEEVSPAEFSRKTGPTWTYARVKKQAKKGGRHGAVAGMIGAEVVSEEPLPGRAGRKKKGKKVAVPASFEAYKKGGRHGARKRKMDPFAIGKAEVRRRAKAGDVEAQKQLARAKLKKKRAKRGKTPSWARAPARRAAPAKPKILTGPRGGRYYMLGNRKVYVAKGKKSRKARGKRRGRHGTGMGLGELASAVKKPSHKVVDVT